MVTKVAAFECRYMVSASPVVSVLQFSGEFLELAVVFLVLAVIAAVLGARGVAGVSMTAAKWLIIAFIVLAIISAVL